MPQRAEDPVLVSARREAIVVLAIWAAACTYSVAYCYLYGYGRPAESITYVWGFPDWIFWGVVMPWSVCTAICFLLAFFVIRDENLGEEQAESDLGSLEETLGGESEHG